MLSAAFPAKDSASFAAAEPTSSGLPRIKLTSGGADASGMPLAVALGSGAGLAAWISDVMAKGGEARASGRAQRAFRWCCAAAISSGMGPNDLRKERQRLRRTLVLSLLLLVHKALPAVSELVEGGGNRGTASVKRKTFT